MDALCLQCRSQGGLEIVAHLCQAVKQLLVDGITATEIN